MLTIKRIHGTREVVKELQNVFENSPDYSLRCTGSLPRGTEAEELFTGKPSGVAFDDGLVFSICLNDEIIGCIDLIRSYPEVNTVFIGLLLLAEQYQQNNYGSHAYRLLEEKIDTWPQIKKVRLGVLKTNEIVAPFWSKMGFSDTGRRVPYHSGPVESEIMLFEKELKK
ncbi:GNAT family N-acetyltransferase [candidate division CSSED10-310 bacterium]|uniref:GNAT family N-acetyltransferase n=1 Tax=candidate division CSSED10-310 bacterium TaxID=2855610 RepID=A0ABV6Z350_UNCC1